MNETQEDSTLDSSIKEHKLGVKLNFFSSIDENGSQLALQSQLQLVSADQPNKIEFNEVFKLKLSKSFLSLYQQSYNHDHHTAALVSQSKYLQSNIKKIDNRPHYWYQGLNQIDAYIKTLESNLTQTKNDIAEFESALNAFKAVEKITTRKDEYQTIVKGHYESLREKQKLEEVIWKTKQQLKEVIDHIASAGFFCRKEINGGYKLYKPIAEKTPGPPLDLDAVKIDSDAVWQDTFIKLQQALINGPNPLITNQNKTQQFLEESKQLKTVEDCSIIKRSIATMTNEIAIADERLRAIKGTDINATLASIKAHHAGQIWALQNETNQYTLWKNNGMASVQRQRGKPFNEANPFHIHSINVLFSLWGVPNYITLNLKLAQNGQLIQQLQQNQTNQEQLHLQQQQIHNVKLSQIQSDKALLQAQLVTYSSTTSKQVLLEERIKFLIKWNNPALYDTKTTETLVDPSVDELYNFYESINRAGANSSQPYQIHHFTYQGDGYYNKQQQSLQEFMQFPQRHSAITLPCSNRDGTSCPGMFYGIINPQRPSMPTTLSPMQVYFVESYTLCTQWKNYALGELISAINLAPTEEREIFVSKQVKSTYQTTQSNKIATEENHAISSFFENNLMNELSDSHNQSYSGQISNQYEGKQNNSVESSFENEQGSKRNSGVKLQGKSEFFSKLLPLSGDASSTKEKSTKSTARRNMNTAFALSQMSSAQILTKTSRDTALKNVATVVKREEAKTSINNKLEVNSVSSREATNEISNTERMKLRNPNERHAVNYLLFQLKNIYSVWTILEDVKIVYYNGNELIQGTDILDKQVYELEHFNKIFKHTPKLDIDTLLCALIAIKVLKNYTDLTGNNAANKHLLQLQPEVGEDIASTMAQMDCIITKLNLKNVAPTTGTETSEIVATKMVELRSALNQLQKFSFKFNKGQIGEKSWHSVNVPAFHMDTQLGLGPASEGDLEQHKKFGL